jgi:general secretion pathway protein J
MSSRRRGRRAFTLLELLVATAMTAVLAGSLYATLHVAFRARRSALAAVEQVRKAELGLELIRADMESAVVPRGILAGAFVGEEAVGGTGLPSDVLMLHCTGGGARQTEGGGDIRMVELGCKPAEDGKGMLLLRRVTVNLLTTKVQEPAEEVLCRDVRAFGLRYFDGTDWLDNWDAGTHDNTLPLAIEVTLELFREEDGAPGEEGGYWACRIFTIPCSSLLPGLQVELGL